MQAESTESVRAGPLRSFPPVVRADARVLILGSMPGEESLRRGQYYAHPRNAFWFIMGGLFGAGPERPYEERLRYLLDARIALWDVIGQCRREGSLDLAIDPESVVPNDIPWLLERSPGIRGIFLNGGGAEYWFRRCFGGALHEAPFAGRSIRRLPSTSPANARLSPRQKLAIWRRHLLAALRG